MRSGDLLLVTWPGGGNVPPLVVLGRRLAERGHRVRVLGESELGPRFEAEGLRFSPLSEGNGWSHLADDVMAEVDRGPTDCAVIDYMQPQALCAAECVGVPFVAFVHTLYNPSAVGEWSAMNMSIDVTGINALRDSLGLVAVERITDLLDLACRVLVATVPDLDTPSDGLPGNVRFVGPMIEDPGPDGGWTPPGGADGTPLVVVSLGSTPMDEAPIVQRVLDALADEPVRVLVTLGAHLRAGDFLAPANAVIRNYMRHSAVFPHASVFVGHGGLGGISAALAFGVPMVCIPLGRDQPNNASRVEAVGAGRTVSIEATKEDLCSAVVDVVGDDKYRVAAQRTASVIASYGNGTSAVDEIERLLHTVRSRA